MNRNLCIKKCEKIHSSDLPSANRFGVLEAPSPINSSDGLVGSGECTLEPDGFLADIGAEIDGRLFTNPNGRPSSGSLSLEPAVKKRNESMQWKLSMVFAIS